MTSRSNIKILLVSAFRAPFIEDDIRILGRRYILKQQIGHGITAILKIIFRVFTADVVFCWFASVYAFAGVFIGKFLGKKTIVVVGGVDAAKDEELGYGIWLNPWKAKLVRYVFRNADRILVVDPCLKEEAMRLAAYDGKNMVYVPTGFDVNFWRPGSEKEKKVLTVATVKDERTFRRKGIDTLIEAAVLLPEVEFTVIGVDTDIALNRRPPLNMKFHSKMPREKILPYYQESQVYCQPSRREGLPNALCEAMLCCCVPVASEVSGNPTAVADTGILVPASDCAALAEGIKNALLMDQTAGMRARARVVALFPIQKRESELARIIERFSG